MRIGLAGTGRIGAFHAATLASLDGSTRWSSATASPRWRTPSPPRCLPAAPLTSPPWSLRIDALVIATSTPGHAELTLAAVDADCRPSARSRSPPPPPRRSR